MEDITNEDQNYGKNSRLWIAYDVAAFASSPVEYNLIQFISF
jgi:hypothetical protein